MVLTLMAWAAVVTSACTVFLGPSTYDDKDTVPRFLYADTTSCLTIFWELEEVFFKSQTMFKAILKIGSYVANATIRFSSRILQAIWREFPLFLITCLLWCSESFRNWNGVLCLSKDLSFWNYAGRCSIVILYAIGLCVIVFKSKYKGVWRTMAYVIVVGLFAIAMFLRKTTGMDITPSSLQLLLETDTREAGDFLNTYVFNSSGVWFAITLLVGVIGIFVVEYLWHRWCKRTIPAFPLFLQIGLLFVLALGLYSLRTYIELFSLDRQEELVRWNVWAHPTAHDPISKILYSAKTVHLVHQQVGQSVKSTLRYVDTQKPEVMADSLIVVLVIGESHISSHSSLYGYSLSTSPRLEREKATGNLVVFTDAITPVHVTSGAMKQILFTGASNRESWYESVYFPAVFRQAGYYVSFYDNQHSMGTGAERNGEDYMILSPMYNSQLSTISYDDTNSEDFEYDLPIVELFKRNYQYCSRHLVIFHLRGQHFGPKERFPNEKKWQVFSSRDYAHRNEPWMTDEKWQTIADYDNACYYNDYVIGEIIELFRDKKAVLVYLSDHGAECYDYRDNDKRREGSEPRQIELLHRVPLVVWMSQSYLASYPEMYEQTLAGCHASFMTDDLPQVLFHLGFVNTSLYVPTADPTNAMYKPKTRIVSDGFDFDEFIH